jgi:small-conductance mechanosensitive channel
MISAKLTFIRLTKVFFLISLFCSSFSLITHANTIINSSGTATSTEQETQQKISQFKQLLANPDVQQWLVSSTSNTDSTLKPSSIGFRENFNQYLIKVQARKQDLKLAWQQLSSAPQQIVQNWRAQMSHIQSLRSIIYLLIFLFVGAGLEWLYTQYAGPKLLSLELQKTQSLKHKTCIGVYRALLTLGGLLCFALGSIGVFLAFSWPALVAYLVLEILITILSFRVILTAIRFLIAPRVRELRLVPLTNKQAKSLFLWLNLVSFMIIFNSGMINVFDKILAQSPLDPFDRSSLATQILSNSLLLAISLLAVYRVYPSFILDRKSEFTTVKVKFWVSYSAIYLCLIFALWIIDSGPLMQSLIVAGLLSPLLFLTRTWLNYLFDQAEQRDSTVEISQQDPSNISPEAISEQEDSFETADNDIKAYDTQRPITLRLMRFTIVISTLLILISIWGYNLFTLSTSPTFSGKLLKVCIDIVAAILIADLIWVWARTYIDKRLTDYVPPEDGHAPGPEARMVTLLPLLRTILVITLISMVTFSVLASLGFNVGPLLAGAGVIGIAIGFGAQTLVKDVVSGIFYLIDDAFRVGEYIELGDLRGTVESISVRSLRVRHHRGAVHTIPFGELKSITNHSRDWVIMKLEFRIPFDTDMKKVKKLIKKIGAQLLENADFGHSFIEPLKSQGVRRMEEFNMVLGVKFMTKPGEQWVIRREAYHQIRDTFEANGINLAERNVKVEVLNGDPTDEKIKQAAASAAQQSVEQPAVKGPIPDEP